MIEKTLTNFEKWLGNVKLPFDKKQFLEDNKELFDIVFEAGKQEAKDEVTFEGMTFFHDVVVDTTGLDLSYEQLKEFFYYLPEWLKGECEQYGMYALKDTMYTYLEENGIPEGYHP